MNIEKKVLIVGLVIGVLALGLIFGYGIGIDAGKENLDDSLEKYSLLLRSELFSDWQNQAVGGVANLTGKSITLERDGSSILIPFLIENVQVSRRVFNEEGILVETEDILSISDIQIGDNVAVLFSVNGEGYLTAGRVFILPQSPPGVTQ